MSKLFRKGRSVQHKIRFLLAIISVSVLSSVTISPSTVSDQVIHAQEEGGIYPSEVIGDDNRRRVEDTRIFPWSAIADLDITFPQGKRSCTGFLLGPRIVVTAGHCIYEHDLEGWATQIEVTPGRNGTYEPYETRVVNDRSLLHVLDEWIVLPPDERNVYDYGVILLPDATTAIETGWFNHIILRADELLGRVINVAGYPGDKTDYLACPINGGCQLWYGAGVILEATDSVTLNESVRLIYYDADTKVGQSGGPVWYRDGGSWNVVAIHRAYNGTKDKNVGVRITSEVIQNIRTWAGLSSSQKIYWTSTFPSGGINRANLDGTSTVETIVSGAGSPQGIVIDETARKFYWSGYYEGVIQRANLDGTNVEMVVDPAGYLLGIALDRVAKKIYWITEGAATGTGRIQRANLDGSSVEDVITGLYSPDMLALDPEAGKVYWTDNGYSGGTPKIQRVNMDGTNREELIATDVYSIALDPAANKMYWDSPSGIKRANLDGSNIENLNLYGGPITLDVVANKIYFKGVSDGSAIIRRANQDGSGLEDLFPIATDVMGIAVEEASDFVAGANPLQPTTRDSVVIEVSGDSVNSCVPEYDTHWIEGRIINVQGRYAPSDFCFEVLTVWSFDAAVGHLDEGAYTINARVVDSGGVTVGKSVEHFEVLPNYFYFVGQTGASLDDVEFLASLWRQQAGDPHDCDGDGLISVKDIMCVAEVLGNDVVHIEPPANPSNASATSLDSSSMLVEWDDNSENEDGFVINDCCEDFGTTGAFPGTGRRSFVVGGLPPETYKCFRVQAFNAVGSSDWSNYGCATTPASGETVTGNRSRTTLQDTSPSDRETPTPPRSEQ